MFNFTDALKDLIYQITESMSDFSHIKPDQLVISSSQTRTAGVQGVYACVTPLRFENGSRTAVRRNRVYRMPDTMVGGIEKLYVVTFYLPRFIDLDYNEKLVTVFHELYHISPEFNGDIRRLPGKNYAHGHSRKKYNDYISAFAKSFLALPGAADAADFLHHNFDELDKLHGGITGKRTRIARPYLDKP